MKTLTRILTLVALVLTAPMVFAANPLGLYNALYGTSKVIYLSFEDGSTTDNYIGTDFAAGDCKISKDGGAVASTTNVPAQITASQPHYSLTLTATEMQVTTAYVTCTDASASAWKDVYFRIETQLNLSRLNLNSESGPSVNPLLISAASGNTAVYIQGGAGGGHGIETHGGISGTGHGLYAMGGTAAGAGIRAVSSSATNSAGISVAGDGTASGLHIVGGATGAGISAIGGSTSGAGIAATASAGNSGGIEATGFGTYAGLRAVGGATGSGITAQAGASGAPGMGIYGIAGNNAGLAIQGNGSASAIQALGGATGHGIYAIGGSTSGHGIYATAALLGHGIFTTGTGLNGDGIRAEALTSGNGINGRGGPTLGYGITGYAQVTGYNGFRAEGVGTGAGAVLLGGATGEGLTIQAGGGNNNGVRIEGAGTGSGFRVVGGATGHGVLAVGGSTSGYGIQSQGQTAAQGHNLFAVPYIDLTAAPTAGTTSFQEAMGALVGRFYNKVTQTSTTQTIFKADSVTTACTKATTDDGTTQVLARCQ